MNTQTEIWNGCPIRFVEKEPGDWWAVGIDVAKALGYAKPSKAIGDHCDGALTWGVADALGRDQATKIIHELDIYNIIFEAAKQSRSKTVKEKAKAFKMWVFGILKTLREASGLEGFQIFRMLDAEHQKDAHRRLYEGMQAAVRVDFIKANTIANKAVSNIYGFPRMIKKGEMTPEMLVRREPILDDTVNLMVANDSFGLGLSVKEKVYGKYCPH